MISEKEIMFYKSPNMQSSTVGGGFSGQAGAQLATNPNTDSPSPTQGSGLTEVFAQIHSRVACLNYQLDVTLQRIHGPRPIAASQPNDKNQETPCIVVTAQRLDSELAILEKHIAEINNFIG